MRILMIGDIVGKPGRMLTMRAIPWLRRREGIATVIANAENVASGSGLTPATYDSLVEGGVDIITMGDHIYRRREIIPILNRQKNIVKPANYPPESPGRDHTIYTTSSGVKMGIISLLGRVFMRPVDCPWHAVDRVIDSLPGDINVIIVEFHAEATSDKQLMGRYLDGRVSAVIGTHTHVTTADEQILPGGTAFQCDIGMTGPHEGILGRKIERVMETTLSFNPTHYDVAEGDVRLSGTILDIDPGTGRAEAIRRLSVREEDVEQWEKDG